MSVNDLIVPAMIVAFPFWVIMPSIYSIATALEKIASQGEEAALRRHKEER
jgi:hypothetical protein